MKITDSERLVILAIKAGYTRTADIAEQTGLSKPSVNRYIQFLRLEHNAHNLATLRAALMPKAPTVDPEIQFASHNSVVLDPALDPALAAALLIQVLGQQYCFALIRALKDQL